MIRVENLDNDKGVLEMQGQVEELLIESVLIMGALAQRLEAHTGIPAEHHIATMAKLANDGRVAEFFEKHTRKQQVVDLGSILWKWGTGDEP